MNAQSHERTHTKAHRPIRTDTQTNAMQSFTTCWPLERQMSCWLHKFPSNQLLGHSLNFSHFSITSSLLIPFSGSVCYKPWNMLPSLSGETAEKKRIKKTLPAPNRLGTVPIKNVAWCIHKVDADGAAKQARARLASVARLMLLNCDWWLKEYFSYTSYKLTGVRKTAN